MNLINKLLGASREKETQKPYAGITDVGKERAANEDYYRIIPEKNLYIVADGMGGHNAGDVASLNATKMVDAFFSLSLIKEIQGNDRKIRDSILGSLMKAHGGILKMAQKNNNYEGMGCTLVVGFFQGNSLHVGHVGDARAYVAGISGMKLLTTDHSYVMELVKRGRLTMEEARVSPLKNRLNQAIGASIDIVPDYMLYNMADGERLLLCSDGLWDMLPDEQLYQILMQDQPAKKICEDLVEMANFAGGHDNITAVVVIHKDATRDLFQKSDSGEFLDTAGEYSYVFKE